MDVVKMYLFTLTPGQLDPFRCSSFDALRVSVVRRLLTKVKLAISGE